MPVLRTYRVAPNLPNTLVLEARVIAELVDTDGRPVPGQRCLVQLPGEPEPKAGATDARGRFIVTHALDIRGEVAISFPDLAADSWDDAPQGDGDATAGE